MQKPSKSQQSRRPGLIILSAAVLAAMLLVVFATPFTVHAAPLCAAETQAAEPSATLPGGLDTSGLADAIDTYFNEHEDTNAALALAVLQGQQTLLQKTYGYADIEAGRATTDDDVFEWGSVTKLLVWVSVMQLAEQDKISLDADIRAYLPDGFFSKLKYSEPITMYNLMHHNAGWQEVIVGLTTPASGEILPLGEALRSCEPAQVNRPGELVGYSNWGVALAGYIVELISGQSFADYVHQNIFQPLGMQHTALLPLLSDNIWVQQQREKIKGYDTAANLIPNDRMQIALYPAGMATGTLADFVLFAKALLPLAGEAGPLFASADTLDEFFSASLYYSDGETPRNAHGMWVEQYGVQLIGHGGNTNAFSSILLFHRPSATAALVMTNQAGEQVYNHHLINLLFGAQQPDKNIAPQPLQNASGFYTSVRTMLKGPASLYTLTMTIPLLQRGDSLIVPFFGVLLVPASGQWVSVQGGESLGLDSSSLMYFDNAASPARLSVSSLDFARMPLWRALLMYLTVLLFAAAVVYSLVVLLGSAIRGIRRRKKGIQLPPSRMRRAHRLMSLAQLALLVNGLLLTVGILSSLTATPPAWRFALHSGVNIVFLVLVAAYWALLLSRILRKKISGKPFAAYLTTGIFALCSVLFILHWQVCSMP